MNRAAKSFTKVDPQLGKEVSAIGGTSGERGQVVLPQGVYVVFDAIDGKPQPSYVAEHRYQAMEHASDLAAAKEVIEEFGPVRVGRYVHESVVEALRELHAIDERKLAASERRTYRIGHSQIQERVERNRALLRSLGESA